MKAVVYEKFGDSSVLQIVDVERPRLKSDEFLVEIKASSVNPVDWKLRKGNWKFLRGYNKPYQAGSDFSGIVRASNVYEYKAGDKVYGMLNPVKGGAYAEYATVKKSQANHCPHNLSFEEAATVPLAGLTALQTLKYKGKIKKGHHVLINACCGGVGHFAVQYAKAMDATVTGICSTNKIELAKQLGVDQVIDYKKEDVYKMPGAYNTVLDPIGTISFSKIKGKLNRRSVFIAFRPTLENIIARITSIVSSKKLKFYLTNVNPEDLEELKELVENGSIKPVIEKVYPLDQIVEAQKISEEGHSSGKIVIKI